MKLILLLVLFATPTLGQTTISGKVIDEKGEPVPGANISVKNSYDGASSALDGTFSFKSEETGPRILVSSFIGYKINEMEVVLAGQALQLIITLRDEINQLDAVTISAGSFTAGEEKRRTILKAVDIATTAGATADIAGALNTLPGTTKVGESGRLFVRGGESNETRTFIDGMAVLEPYSPAANNTPSRGRFLPFMFKGTSFSTGGYSAEYGQALSSALVLTSKDKAEMNQTDFGILSVGADVAHTQVWDRSSASAKIQYTNIRPYFGLINQRIDWNTPPASIDGSAAFRQQVGVDGLLKVFGNVSHSNYSLFNHDILDPSKKQLVELTNNYAYGNTAYRQSLNENWSMRGGISYNYNSNLYHLDGRPAEELERGVHTKLVFENSLSDKLELRFGAETITRDYAASRQDEESSEYLTQSFRETIGATYVETEAYANKHFVAKVGIRGEYNSLLHAFSADPRVSLAYRPGKQGQFAFAYGTFRQSARNLYLRANNLLNNEKADHYILNYQVIENNRTFRIETYYKKYYDLVKFGNGDPNTLTNDGSGYAKGVELFFRDNQTFRNVDYWVSYSFLDTKRDYLSFPSLATPSFASMHNFSAVYKHFVSKIKSQLGFTYSYSSGRPYYNPNNANFHSDQTPSYHDLSANVAYLPKNWLILYVSVTNILGRDNVFGYNYSPTPGPDGLYASSGIRQPALRFFFVGLFITISKNKSVNQLPNL